MVKWRSEEEKQCSLRRNFISEPPSTAPVFTINEDDFIGTDDSNEISVVEGVSTPVSCSVSGGVPATTETKIKCGRRTISGTQRFNRFWNGRTCTCTGDHPSGCYTNSTSVKIKVACEFLFFFQSLII